MMAECLWETRETWSFFRKLQEAFRMDRAFVKSRHWLTSPQDLQYRKYILYKATTTVKAFRRQVRRGELTPDAISQRKAAVYRSYAQAMNEVEIWTGQSGKIYVQQGFLTLEQTIASLALSIWQNARMVLYLGLNMLHDFLKEVISGGVIKMLVQDSS